MQKNFKNFLIAAVICLAFMLFVLNGTSFAGEEEQEKKSTPELLEEIAGNYEFEYEGQFIVFAFSVEDGKLKGAPEGEAQEELESVQGEEMTFVGYAPDGTEFRFAFKRDVDGKITICKMTIPAEGIEVEGTKIKD